MDSEALKIILDLQHKVTMYKRALDDLSLICGGANIPIVNYGIDHNAQTAITQIADSLRSKQE